MADKSHWRAWARSVREELDFATLSRLTVRHVARSGLLRRGSTVLVYFPLGDEIDVTPLGALDIRLAATRTPPRGGALELRDASGELERHRYGFLQPSAAAATVEPRDIDVVLTPGLAFDLSGGRLGRGAAYYDELFTRLPTAKRIGVVPSMLVVEEVPTERHDVPMHALATELGVTAVEESASHRRR